MAQAMTAARAVLLAACAAWLTPAQAQDADPTRPPAVMTAPMAGAGALPRTVRGTPQLQSILVSLRPGGRRVAVIDGKMVRQGQRVGDAVVTAIGATDVVLRRGGKTETLKLFRPATRVATVQP